MSPTKRTESTLRQKSTGKIFKITKGAPHILQHLEGENEVTAECGKLVTAFGEDGVRCMAISMSEPITNWVEGSEAPCRPLFAPAYIFQHMGGRS